MNKKMIIKMVAGCGVIGGLIALIVHQNKKYHHVVRERNIAWDEYDEMVDYMEDRIALTEQGYEDILDYVKDELEDIVNACDGVLDEKIPEGEE